MYPAYGYLVVFRSTRSPTSSFNRSFWGAPASDAVLLADGMGSWGPILFVRSHGEGSAASEPSRSGSNRWLPTVAPVLFFWTLRSTASSDSADCSLLYVGARISGLT